jgi:phosphoglycerate kinase
LLKKKTVENVNFAGKRALIRADYNVPLDSNRNITDDIRIRSTLPTINHVLDAGGSVILMSHLGRPKGKIMPEMSLAPVAKRLGRLLHQDVRLAPDCIGEEAERLAGELQPGDVLLLENLRFHPGEASNDLEFSRRLALLGDVYVDDAFANAHRQHASMIGVPKLLKPAVAGFLVKSEISCDSLKRWIRSSSEGGWPIHFLSRWATVSVGPWWRKRCWDLPGILWIMPGNWGFPSISRLMPLLPRPEGN